MAAIARLARSRLCVALMRHSLYLGTPGWHPCREWVAFRGLRTYTTPVNSELVVTGKPQGSKLVTPGVPQGSKVVVPGYSSGVGVFTSLHNELVYIDKTQLIVPTPKLDTVLLCRPRRFGKTLTLSMLQYFHGVDFRDRYAILFKVSGLVNQHLCRAFNTEA
jgi:hypothetical protein